MEANKMKKVISVFLAALMIACCVPFSVFAASQTETFTASANFTSSNQLSSDVEYIIPEGVTMTVPSNLTLYIPANARLTVNKGGTLNVLGSIVIMNFGELYASGIIDHGSNIQIADGADNAAAMVQMRFPDLNDDAVRLADKITVAYSYDDVNQSVPVGGGSYFVPLNKEIRIDAHIIEPTANYPASQQRDKFDDSLLKIKFNNVGLTYVSGAKADTGYFTTTATTGGDISYAKWTNDADFLTTKRIILPSGEGYEVLPRYPDKVQRTEDGTIVVKYGEPFSFYVDLDEAYDMSNYEVYIYNGYGWLNLGEENQETGELEIGKLRAEPDANGYFNVSQVTGDLTISVQGVMKNATINLIGNLLETFRNIFNMLKEFIESLKDLFSGFSNNG